LPYIERYWVLEGTARMFEDIVYDNENPYMYDAYYPMYYSNGRYIVNILENITDNSNRYRTFAFWKLMQEKCTLDMQKMLRDPLGNFNLVANSCSDIPDVYGDKLAGVFLLYNWAMVLNNNMNFFEKDEVYYNFRISTKVKKINKPNFQENLDMKYMVDGTVSAYGAKSFLITHETLASSGDMNLTFKSNGDLKLIAVRVKADGSSDVNDNFVMDSNTQFYKLTEVDRAGGLFITLVNTTGGEIGVEELNLTKEELGVVIDKAAGLMWQDKYEGRSKFHYGAYSTVSYYCSNLSLANYNDWRVPSVHELEKMYNTGLVSKFTNTLSRERWSSTFSHVDNGWGASSWYFTFDFSTGKISESKYRNKELIICVRDL